ncbi:MAG: hypothetical protein IJ033_01980 [Clostridia bacterium]|nr:hypothetical protein [Clostridia bacterium]
MKNVLKTILYIIGFPALVALVAYNSLIIYEEGGTYGFWPFVGLIIAGLCLIVYTIVFIVTGKNSKKNKGNHKKVMKSVATLVVMAFVLTSGIWLVVDIALPGILKDATDGTRLFKHMQEDYKAQAEVHGQLLEDYIRMNCANGNLPVSDDFTEDDWVEAGYRSPEVQELLAQNFKSMDVNGYKTFTTNGPWLNMANNNRLTIPVLVHLVLNEREVDEEVTYYLAATLEPKQIVTDEDGDDVYKKPVANKEVETVLHWTILDMQGTSMNIDLSGALSGLGIDLGTLLGGTLEKPVSSILETVNEAIADPALAGAELYIGIDLRDDSFQIMLTPAAESRGMHGYQNSAWLNSNNLLFAVISIFPARQWLYIWGAVVIFSSVAVAALRVKQYGGKKEELVADDDDDDEPINVKGLNNYERTVVTALHARNKMK